MRIDTEEYGQYLEKKYLPGRSFYLNYLIYPKYLKEFKNSIETAIYDFGCGNGEFLKFCNKKRIQAIGIDSNYSLVEECQKKGLNVIHDNIVNFNKLGVKIKNAICDNVIEHLTYKVKNFNSEGKYPNITPPVPQPVKPGSGYPLA